MKKYQVTDSRGRVWKRRTDRDYAFAVVTLATGVNEVTGQAWSREKAEWRRTRQLAEACARQNQGEGRAVEIIEAQEV